MKMHLKAILFFSIVVMLAGCIKIPLGDGESLKISKDGFTFSDADGKETQVNIDKDEGKVSVSGDDGEEVSIGANADIPEQFPSDIPIPESAIIISGVTLDDESDDRTTSVIYVFEGEFDELVELYKEFLSSGNFDSIEDSDTDEAIATVKSMYTNAGQQVEVMHGYKGNEMYNFQIREYEDDGNVTVTIIHNVKK